MAVLTERVDRLELALASFVEHTERMVAAIHEDVAEIRASNARTDRKLLEMQQQADRDRQQAERSRQQDRQQAEKSRQQDREQTEKDRIDFNKRLAEIADAHGRLIEDMVWPNGSRIAMELFEGDVIVTSAIRVKRKHPADAGQMMEIDLFVAGSRHLFVCEAKSKVTPEKVADYLERVARIPEFFPEFAVLKILPALASVHIDESMVKHLNRCRVYAVAFGDETMELLNKGAF